MTVSTKHLEALPIGDVKQKLHNALAHIPAMSECALLDYPEHVNIGDHLIWLGDISYLLEERDVKVSYIASSEKFSPEDLERAAGKSPILLHGGGNLGDIWTRAQSFREYIIKRYTDRPIVILPQTLFFSSTESLAKTAKVFNSHPNLMLFTRDRYSYQIASKHFHQCQIYLAPDMAFQLIGKPEFERAIASPKGIFYMQRQDNEKNLQIDPRKLSLKDLTVGDWSSYQRNWVMGGTQSRLKQIAGAVVREGLQRGLMVPQEYFSRSQWLKKSPLRKTMASSEKKILNFQSLSFIHAGIYQFDRYEAVITNRLH